MLELLKKYLYFLKLKYNHIFPFSFLQTLPYTSLITPLQIYGIVFFVVVTYMYKYKLLSLFNVAYMYMV